MGREFLSDRAPGGHDWIAQSQRTSGKAAGRLTGGAIWGTLFAGQTMRDGGEAENHSAGQASQETACRRATQRLESEFRSEESAENLASGAAVGSPQGRSCLMDREWREGKVRPLQGNSPHDRPVSRGIRSSRRICDDPFSATPVPLLQRTILRPPVCVFKAWRNLSGPMWFQSQNQNQNQNQNQPKPWGEADTASRRSAPSPGRRTRREDHALAHRPQMTGYSSIGLLASIARLRFTGTRRITCTS